MPEKSVEKILKNMQDSALKRGQQWHDINEDIFEIEQATQAIRDYYLAKLPKKRESKYIDSPEAIQYNNESYLKTEGYNQAIAEMRRAIEKG